MKTAIIQFRFKGSISDFSDEIGYMHEYFKEYMKDNLPSAELVHVHECREMNHQYESFFEDDTEAPFVVMDFAMKVEDKYFENYYAQEYELKNYILNNLKFEFVAVHQHYDCGNDQFFLIEDGSLSESSNSLN